VETQELQPQAVEVVAVVTTVQMDRLAAMAALA
jgi:hypothetical protein